MTSDMILLTRTYDLLKWILPKIEKFPKLYRNNVTQRMMNALLDFQESLLEAHSYDGKIRLRHLRKADVSLNKLRVYLRLIYDWRWLSHGQYEHVSRMVAEIGRLLGAWIKLEEQ